MACNTGSPWYSRRSRSLPSRLPTTGTHTHTIQAQGGTTLATTGTQLGTASATGGSSRAMTTPTIANTGTTGITAVLAATPTASGGTATLASAPVASGGTAALASAPVATGGTAALAEGGTVTLLDTLPTPGPFRWRQRRAWAWLVHRMYGWGVIAGSISSGTADGWIVHGLCWRGARPYILGRPKCMWGRWPLVHRLRYGHWPETVWMGMCGVCAPWQCCGATGFDHSPDCPESEAPPLV